THDAWAQRDQIERASAEAIASLMRSANVRLRFIAQVSATEQDDDRLAVERLRKLLPDDLQERVEVAEPAVSLEEAVAQYASCDVLLASRLHASLLAMATGVPSLVVGYEPKVVGVLSGLGLASRIVDARDPGAPEALANRLLSLMSPAERERTLAAANTADAGFEPLDRELRTKLTRPVARSDRSGAVPKGDPSG
ncbi:MAG TPA: polysaccharide pyruvyl transferase family protein, partial [Candidatus Limnocylindrales bacterium]|nr:polysaccharide pyruvyl transferase family protein [Candidatus Limnocylindrales bacterium]